MHNLKDFCVLWHSLHTGLGPSQALSLFNFGVLVQAALTKYHRVDGLNNRNLFLTVPICIQYCSIERL